MSNWSASLTAARSTSHSAGNDSYEYLVNETLAGRGERLKAYNVALEVFERPETFDPAIDPLVRIEAARLREKLREYYGTDGKSDPIRIDLPKGTYAPLIEFREGEQPVKSVSKRRMRWQRTTVPVLALILVLGAVGAWLTRELWAPAPEDAAGTWARRVQWTGDRGPSLRQLERRPATRVFQRRLD